MDLALYATVGMAEELYFRELIPNILEQGFNRYEVIFISTLIFGLAHSSIALSNSNYKVVLLNILNALIFGFLAIELKFLTKNITVLMFIHFLSNFQSKFVSINSTELLYRVTIRGAIMLVYTIMLFKFIKKIDKQNQHNTKL